MQVQLEQYLLLIFLISNIQQLKQNSEQKNKKYYQKPELQIIDSLNQEVKKMSILLTPEFVRLPPLNKNELLISSCTDRLIQLQRQLDNRFLEQQLVSSVVMKEQAIKRLSEEQDLLITYLKQQLEQLHLKNVQCQGLSNAVIQLENQCYVLQQRRVDDIQANQCLLRNLKPQYQQQADVLSQVTNQSTNKYELVLKYRERNTITQSLLAQKQQKLILYTAEHQRATKIHQANIVERDQLQTQTQSQQTKNIQLTKSHFSKGKELDSNQQKLFKLQRQVQRLEEDRQRLMRIQRAASKDNSVLKEQLKDRTRNIKAQQDTLKQLSKLKQNLEKQRQRQTQRLNNQKKQSQKAKQNYNQQLVQGKSFRKELQELAEEKTRAQIEMVNLGTKISQLKNINQNSLRECFGCQQQIEKSLYFIDQYIVVNKQLMREMEILLKEEVRKESLDMSYNNVTKDRSMFIAKLKNLITTFRNEIIQTETAVTQLSAQFESYKIQ